MGRPAASLAVVAAATALLVLVAAREGPGITPDSVTYASAARSLAQSGALTTYTGETLTIFPPGYPGILASMIAAGVDLESGVVVLNAVCAALSVWLAYTLARFALDSHGLALLTASVAGLSASSVGVFRMLWSEPPFNVLVTAVLMVLARVVSRGQVSWWEAVTLSTAVSLATTLRFAGVTLIPIVGLGLLLAHRTRGWRHALMQALLISAVSGLGLGAVVARNLLLGVAPLGDRSAAERSLADVFRDSLLALGNYLVPATWTLGAVAAGLVVLGLLTSAAARVVWDRDAVLLIVAAFSAAYWGVLVHSQLTTRIDAINARLLLPVLAPMCVLVLHAGRMLVRGAQRHLSARPAAWLTAQIALLVLFLTFTLARSVALAVVDAEGGLGYNKKTSLRSELALSVRTLPEDAGIASSDAALVYWVSGRAPVLPLPASGRASTDVLPEDGINLRRLVSRGDVSYIAVFDGYRWLTPVSAEKIGIRLESVSEFADGTLYRSSIPN